MNTSSRVFPISCILPFDAQGPHWHFLDFSQNQRINKVYNRLAAIRLRFVFFFSLAVSLIDKPSCLVIWVLNTLHIIYAIIEGCVKAYI
jgi:hypothetical protein